MKRKPKRKRSKAIERAKRIVGPYNPHRLSTRQMAERKFLAVIEEFSARMAMLHRSIVQALDDVRWARGI